jgi:aminoglycoside/choline kinase family phosphotransferase
MINTEKLISLFKIKFGEFPEKITHLKEHSSDRRIFRLISRNHQAIGIANENIKENKAFINFTYSFFKKGFRVPEIYSKSKDNKYYLLQDLGDITLHQKISSKNTKQAENIALFKKSIDKLVEFQITAPKILDFKYCFQTKEFNKELISTDLKKFEEFYFNVFCIKKNKRFLDYTKNILLNLTEYTSKRFFMYRDFQPRNIMIYRKKLFFIDYQTGRYGPPEYDLASFLYSGSIKLTEKERTELIKYYINKFKSYFPEIESRMQINFYYFVLLRLLQVLGSYGYVYSRKSDKEILKKIPKALRNLRSILSNIENRKVYKFVENIVKNYKRKKL